MTAVWILIIAVAVFLAVIVARACMFKPVSDKKVEADSFSVDTKSATEHLRQMVRLKTVSNVEESQVDLGEFEKFRALYIAFIFCTKSRLSSMFSSRADDVRCIKLYSPRGRMSKLSCPAPLLYTAYPLPVY